MRKKHATVDEKKTCNSQCFLFLTNPGESLRTNVLKKEMFSLSHV